MKTKFLMVAIMSLLSFTTISAAPKTGGLKIKITEKASPENAASAQKMQARLDEINAMDVKNLSAEEKQSIKEEIKAMKKETKQMDGVYFYFGGAGLILLIILLIIIF